MTLRIGIVGAGICGLALARLLGRQGYDVKLFDRSEQGLDAGSGILIAPNGMRILKELELAADVLKAGARINRGGLKDECGRMYSVIENLPDLATVGILRSQLHQILRQGIDAVLHPSMEVQSVRETFDGVVVEFKGGQSECFDYLIGTDGLNSAVRRALFEDEILRDSGLVCWRGTCPRREVKGALNQADDFFEYWGRGSRFGYGAVSQEDIYWFAVLKTSVFSNEPDWQTAFQKYSDGIPEIIQKTPKDKIIRRQLLDRRPTGRWFTKRVVLAGDAVHPAMPNMGQGACMALESAWVLAQTVKDEGFGQAAFRRYQDRRLTRTSLVNKKSYLIGQIGHMQNPLGLWLRSLILKMLPDQSKQLQKFYHAEI